MFIDEIEIYVRSGKGGDGADQDPATLAFALRRQVRGDGLARGLERGVRGLHEGDQPPRLDHPDVAR